MWLGPEEIQQARVRQSQQQEQQEAKIRHKEDKILH